MKKIFIPIFLCHYVIFFIAAQELPPSLENTEEYCKEFREAYKKGDRALKSGNVAAVEQADKEWKKKQQELIDKWNREKQQTPLAFCAGVGGELLRGQESLSKPDEKLLKEQKKLPFSPSNVRYGTLPSSERKRPECE